MASETLKHQDVMLDIETMALTPDAVVLSVAAVAFTPRNSALEFGEQLLVVPNFMEQIMEGRRVDPGTQKWWADPERNLAAQHWLHPDKNITVRTALAELASFIRRHAPVRVWANGVVFDIGILEHLFRSDGVVVPWKYDMVRDSRTIRNEIPPKSDREEHPMPDGGLPHHPVSDCKAQIRDLWIRGF